MESTTTKMKLTRDEAQKWVKRALPGTSFHAHIALSVVIDGDNDHHYPTGHLTSVALTRVEALKMVREYLTDKGEAKGDRIPCSVYVSSSITPGRADYVSYWIG